MSYLLQFRLTEERTLLARVGACVAPLGLADPLGWAYERAWQLAVQPGWVAAYASAMLAHEADPENVPPPGANEAAITDLMVLSAVQTIRGSEKPHAAEPPSP